jgi:type VI secretion system secreted protein VgrG
MPIYIQNTRPLRITTPLGPDAMLLVGLSGHEAISRLFLFRLDLLVENETTVPFEQILGQAVTVELGAPDEDVRYLSGICSRIGQGSRDQTFTAYHLDMVPQLWFLTRIAQSRIFQQLTVPEILAQVFKGLKVDFQLTGRYEPRDYCVQYRETDFHFASRMMEEEGIFYFFRHSARGHTLVVADSPGSFPELPQPLIFDEPFTSGNRPEERIGYWEKAQELRSGKVTLRDHCFELPHKHLEAQKTIQDSAAVGQVTHKLKIGTSDKLELYDFPGEYAQRFDGVNPDGGDRPDDVQKIFADNQRTAGIRMQEEAAAGLIIRGSGNVRALTSGSKFTLQRHFDADGAYLLTGVEHTARLTADYRTGDPDAYHYSANFTCIPAGLPFRPARATPKPFVQGTQTAVVVGPPGEEIFTDKYGRVKVQFHWDRQGKNDQGSSCWVRVAQVWAGRRWGSSFWPRIGQEVIVAFQEGDPDQPIIIGSVYNADQMPPYLGNGPDSKHPNDNKLSGIKSNATKGGDGYNEWRFDDTKGKEQVFIHAQRDMDLRVLNDTRERIKGNRHLIVGAESSGGDQLEALGGEKHLIINRHHVEHIRGDMELLIGPNPEGPEGGNQDIVIKKDKKERVEGNSHLAVKGIRAESVGGSDSLSVGGDRFEAVGGTDHRQVKADRNEKVDGNQSLTIGGDQQEKVGGKHAVEAAQEIHLKAGMKVIIESGVQLTLKGPGGFVDINPGGVTIQGLMVLINSGGSAGSGSGSSPAAPKGPAAPEAAKLADPRQPDNADNSITGRKSN